MFEQLVCEVIIYPAQLAPQEIVRSRHGVLGRFAVLTRALLAQDSLEAVGLAGLLHLPFLHSAGARDHVNRERAAALAVFLASDASGTLSGRVLSHADDFDTLASRIAGIMASDAYTLRRVEEK